MKKQAKPLLDWNNLPIIQERQSENPMVVAHGAGPADQKCKGCRFLVGIQRSRVFWKCRKRGITSGPGTDHRRAWPACKQFEPREGETLVYDGR